MWKNSQERKPENNCFVIEWKSFSQGKPSYSLENKFVLPREQVLGATEWSKGSEEGKNISHINYYYPGDR